MKNDERLQRKEIIEGLLLEGYAPIGVKNSKGSFIPEAARIIGVYPSSIRRWLVKEEEYQEAGDASYLPNWSLYSAKKDDVGLEDPVFIEFADIPVDDIPINRLLDQLQERNDLRIKSQFAKEWQEIKIDTEEPIVVAFVGDPHIDSPTADITLLRQHISQMNEEGVYAFCLGDMHDNWVGNLARLYAHSDVSRKTAIRLLNWFMNESGVRWLGFVVGNHDTWNNGQELLEALNKNKFIMEEWELKVNLKFPTGLEVPIWLSHDFKGKSAFNKVHGLVKAARERHKAKILAAGHTHEFGYYTEEMPDSDHVYHAIRSRGYKIVDSHAIINGYPTAKYGQTMCAVINPKATSAIDEITIFADVEKALRYKNALKLIKE